EGDVFHLGRIVITPSRLYQEYGQVSRATNLITEEEIADKNPMRVGDLIEDLPSALLMENGSLGHVSSIRFRGATSSQTLVLIDDMPINNPRDGVVNLSDYSTENIESIEVVRGPSSSLYGSSAVGGTINIITKEGKSEIPETTLTSRFGTYYTHIHELTHGAKIKWFDYFLSTTGAYSRGSRDNSDYKAETVNGNVGFDMGDQHHLKVSGRLHQSELGSPGHKLYFDKDDKLEEKQNYLNAIWESHFDDIFQLKPQGYTNLDRLGFVETVYPTLDKDTHQVKNRALNLQASYCLFKDYTVMFGIEGKKHLLNSSSSGKYSYIARSMYGLTNLRFFDMLDIVGGARVDDYSTFGTEVSPNINGSLKIGPFKIRGLAARSYRAPTFNDLYWPTEEYFPASLSFLWPIYGRGAKGNSELTPEKGETYEMGIDNIMDFVLLKKFPVDTRAGVTVFRTEMEDLINWDIDPSDYYWKPFNVNKARIEGVELEGEAAILKDIRGSFNYTFTKAKDKDTKRYLTYRPRHKFDFSASYKHPWGIIGKFRSQYVAGVFTDTDNNIQVKPYWLFGTDLYYDIDEQTRYFVNIDNMFNRTYEKSKGYPMPGFTITTGVRVRF
ncbi:MAG: TonB-dependent receptor, partial [Candidatus Omnitrophota bacterium]